jgi:hypothetical protein
MGEVTLAQGKLEGGCAEWRGNAVPCGKGGGEEWTGGLAKTCLSPQPCASVRDATVQCRSVRFNGAAASMHRWLGTSRRGAECTKSGSSPLLPSPGRECRPSHRMSQGHPPRLGASSVRKFGCAHFVHGLCLGSATFLEGTLSKEAEDLSPPARQTGTAFACLTTITSPFTTQPLHIGHEQQTLRGIVCAASTSEPYLVSLLN